jgi:hypothetical protein
MQSDDRSGWLGGCYARLANQSKLGNRRYLPAANRDTKAPVSCRPLRQKTRSPFCSKRPARRRTVGGLPVHQSWAVYMLLPAPHLSRTRWSCETVAGRRIEIERSVKQSRLLGKQRMRIESGESATRRTAGASHLSADASQRERRLQTLPDGRASSTRPTERSARFEIGKKHNSTSPNAPTPRADGKRQPRNRSVAKPHSFRSPTTQPKISQPRKPTAPVSRQGTQRSQSTSQRASQSHTSRPQGGGGKGRKR